MKDTRTKREQSDEAVSRFARAIRKIYGVNKSGHTIEVWTPDDETNPLPGNSVLRVTLTWD